MKKCQIQDCGKTRIARGWCHMHYKRWQLHGSPDVLIIPQEYHGMVRTPEYRIWTHMKGRCNNVSDSRYVDYGGRGIKVCDRWNDSFAAFYADMGERPKGLTLDRIDNDGNYEPSNCRWATHQEQQLNKRVYKNSQSGLRGIRKVRSGKWEVRIGVGGGRQKYIGTFATLAEAKAVVA